MFSSLGMIYIRSQVSDTNTHKLTQTPQYHIRPHISTPTTTPTHWHTLTHYHYWSFYHLTHWLTRVILRVSRTIERLCNTHSHQHTDTLWTTVTTGVDTLGDSMLWYGVEQLIYIRGLGPLSHRQSIRPYLSPHVIKGPSQKFFGPEIFPGPLRGSFCFVPITPTNTP